MQSGSKLERSRLNCWQPSSIGPKSNQNNCLSLLQAKLYWCIVETCLMSLWLMKILIQYVMTINNANFDIADAISDAAEVVFYAMRDC